AAQLRHLPAFGPVALALLQHRDPAGTPLHPRQPGADPEGLVPQAVFPLSVVGSNLVNFALSFVPLLLLMAVVRQPFTTALFFLPVAMLILTVFISGVTLLFATFTVFFRDVRHLAEVALQMLMYLSPVFYDLEMLGQHDT